MVRAADPPNATVPNFRKRNASSVNDPELGRFILIGLPPWIIALWSEGLVSKAQVL